MQSSIKNGGSNAAAKAAENRGQVLRWLLKWRSTDRHIVGEILGLKRSGAFAVVASMVRDGFIGEIRVTGCPVRVLYLREPGLRLAQRLLAGTQDETMTAPARPSKIVTNHIAHDLLVQRYALQIERRLGSSAELLSSYQVAHRRQEIGRSKRVCSGGLKLPDALLIAAGERIAIEVQETFESRDVAERKLRFYHHAITLSEVDRVIYASTSPGIVAHLKKISEGDLRDWCYERELKAWVAMKGQTFKVGELRHRFLFEHIRGLDRCYYTARVA